MSIAGDKMGTETENLLEKKTERLIKLVRAGLGTITLIWLLYHHLEVAPFPRSEYWLFAIPGLLLGYDIRKYLK